MNFVKNSQNRIFKMDRMSEKIIQLTASVLIRMFNTGAQFSTTIQRLHSRYDKQ